jgi:hypothetical protein
MAFHASRDPSSGDNFGKKRGISGFWLKLTYSRFGSFRYTTPAFSGVRSSQGDRPLPTVAGHSADPSPLRLHSTQKGTMMAKPFAMLLAGLALVSSAAGCCCSGMYGRGGGCSPCATGGCAPAYYPPGGTGYNSGYGGSAFMGGYNQTAFAGDPALMTASPAIPGSTYTTTAGLAPINALPAY